jgi:hypothetical protein
MKDYEQIRQNKRLNRFSNKWAMPMETGQDSINALIQMNELSSLIKDFEAPGTAVSGLERLGGDALGVDTANKVYEILQNQQPFQPSGTGAGFDITNIMSNILEGKQYKDSTNGWDVGIGSGPDYSSGGGGIQVEPEKMQGIMALLQRLLPGGKTGYK